MVDTSDIPVSSYLQTTTSAASKSVTTRETPELTAMQKGHIVNAVVLRQDKNGNAVLQLKISDTGLAAKQNIEITVTTKIPLQAGSSLVLKILVNSFGHKTPDKMEYTPDFQARIISVNGKAPQKPNHEPKTPFENVTKTIADAAKLPDEFDIIKLAPKSSFNSSNTNRDNNTQTAPLRTSVDTVNISNGTISNGIMIKTSPIADNFLPKSVSVKTDVSAPTVQTTPSSKVSTSDISISQTPLKNSDNITLHIISTNVANSHKEVISDNMTHTSKTLVAKETAEHIAAYKDLSQQPILKQNSPTTTISQSVDMATSKATNSVSPITNNQSFTGTVIGIEQSGEVVLKTPLGIIKLPADIALPQGTTLEMEVVKIDSDKNIVKDESIAVKNINHGVADKTTIFNELASILGTLDAEMGTSFVKEVIPSGKKQFAAKLLWFIVNVNSGSVSSWLGTEARKTLEQYDKTNIISRLKKTFSSIKAAFTEPNSSGWNTLMMPFYDGTKLQNAILYVRRDKKGEKEEDKEDDVRFVVEIEFDIIGDIQLDGFVKTIRGSKELTLFLRTKEQISPDMKNELLRIFTQSSEITGMSGSLQFQATKEFPVNPAEELIHTDSGIIV